jgi:predicted DNA-binding transcriptional regulator AlpA
MAATKEEEVSEWQVTLTFAGSPGEEALVALGEALEVLDASVAAIPSREQFTVSFPVEATRVSDAIRDACKHSMYELHNAGLPDHLAAVEALEPAEYERRAWAPTVPDVVGPIEAAQILSVSRQRVHQLASENRRFPRPLISTKSGSLWARSAVEAFALSWTRKPGRPAKQPLDQPRSRVAG